MVKNIPSQRGWLSYSLAWLATFMGAVSLALAVLGVVWASRILWLSDVAQARQRILELLPQEPAGISEEVNNLKEFSLHGFNTISSLGRGLWIYLLAASILILLSLLTLLRTYKRARRWTLRALALAITGVLLGCGVSAWSAHARDAVSKEMTSEEGFRELSLPQQQATVNRAARGARSVEYLYAGFALVAGLQTAALCIFLVRAALPCATKNLPGRGGRITNHFSGRA